MTGMRRRPPLRSYRSSLWRKLQIADRFILANLQGTEYAIEVRRFCRVSIRAAEARMNHPDMASAPLRPALFHSPAIVRADGKLHCTEIASFAEVTPAATFLRHLVHVGEVLAQIAVTGFDKTGAMLEPDAADISRVERGRDLDRCPAPDWFSETSHLSLACA